MEGSRIRRWMDRLGELAHSLYARRVLTALGSFLSGLLCSRGLVFGKYSPFGVAAVAAAPREGLWAAVAGAALGYLLPSPAYITVRYTAAVLAVAAIRWSLSELPRVNGHPLFAPLVTFFPLLLTGATMVFLSGSVNYTAALYLAESFLGAGVSYFLRRSGDLLLGRTPEGDPSVRTPADSGDVAALAVSVGVLVLAFSGMSVAGVSLGRICMALLVLVCARVGGVSGGAVAGVTAGALQGLSTAGLSHLSGAYGLGGLMAGVFSPLGKVATAVAFILSHGVASLQAGGGLEPLLAGAMEVAVATVLYMVLPSSPTLSQLFALRGDSLSGGALRNNMVLRLHHASQALASVYDAVEEISQKLSALCAPNMQGVYDRAAGAACSGCPKSSVCWTKYKDDTLETLAGLTRPLKEKGRVELEDWGPAFLERCVRAPEFRDEINKNYDRYLLKEAAELRASQVREAAEQHFRTTAGILEDMAGEFAQYQCFDEEAAARVAEILRDNGAQPVEVCCRVDRLGRMTVEAELLKERQKQINKAVFTREISAACGRTFSPPCVVSTGDRCRIQMCQRPAYNVGRGFSQLCAGGGAFCGDCTSVFEDGAGRLVAVLSDGMGTGGRAAVDGAMTCSMTENLLKAGIGFDSTLQTVNAALMAKAGDESLATLDVTSVDLFTGETVFRKAGAAATLVRRGRRLEEIEASSVPVGILPGVEFAAETRDLSPGDLIVMVSDGVAVSGTHWLSDLVLHWDETENPNLLAERITDEAKKRRADGHEDDVTALVLVVQEN